MRWDWEVGRARPGRPREVNTKKCSWSGDEIGDQVAATSPQGSGKRSSFSLMVQGTGPDQNGFTFLRMK